MAAFVSPPKDARRVQERRADVGAEELGERVPGLEQRRVQRRAGEGLHQGQHDPLGPTSLGEVVVHQGDVGCAGLAAGASSNKSSADFFLSDVLRSCAKVIDPLCIDAVYALTKLLAGTIAGSAEAAAYRAGEAPRALSVTV